MSRDQRKIGNIIIEPGSQLRLLAPFLMYLIVTIGLIVAITYRFKVSLDDVALLLPTENTQAVQKLDELGAQLFAICVGGVVISGLMCLASWTIVSHRIYGPMIQVKRRIEALRDGDYDSEFTIRKYDEFQDVSKALDHLAKVLKATRPGATTKKVTG